MSVIVPPVPRRRRLPTEALVMLRLLSLLDGLLLAVLVYAALTRQEMVIAVIGPTHGLLFLLLVASIGWAARHRWWSWSFVAAVAVFGPFASVPGLERARRRQA